MPRIYFTVKLRISEILFSTTKDHFNIHKFWLDIVEKLIFEYCSAVEGNAESISVELK